MLRFLGIKKKIAKKFETFKDVTQKEDFFSTCYGGLNSLEANQLKETVFI